MTHQIFETILDKSMADTLNLHIGFDKIKEGVQCVIGCSNKYTDFTEVFQDISDDIRVYEFDVFMHESNSVATIVETYDFSKSIIQIVNVSERSYAETVIRLGNFVYRDRNEPDAIPSVFNIIIFNDNFTATSEIEYAMKMVDRYIVMSVIYGLYDSIKRFFIS